MTFHPADSPPPAQLLAALESTLAGHPELLLAVSGGLDSMTLMRAVARWRPGDPGVVVATFDHRSGPASKTAARLVKTEAGRLGFQVVAGRAASVEKDEAGWREARWSFLRSVAAGRGARIVTAHTRDDLVETVVQRLLRDSGVRGLAALLAPSAVLRPWLGVSRALLERWAAAARVPYVVDPTNESRRHQRNRVRHDLLPALRRVRPLMDVELLAVAGRAAGWRADVERLVDHLGPRPAPGGGISVAREMLDSYSPVSLANLWPAVAARAGVRLDRRGTHRLAEFTTHAGRVGRVPLSAGAEVLALPDAFIVRRRPESPSSGQPLADGVVESGIFSFRRLAGPADDEFSGAGMWGAALAADVPHVVRGWQAGDRVRPVGAPAARRVKRYLAEAGIPGPLREGWPVVVAAGEIVWIPGVCRSVAATARPGRPEVYYVCDRISH